MAVGVSVSMTVCAHLNAMLRGDNGHVCECVHRCVCNAGLVWEELGGMGKVYGAQRALHLGSSLRSPTHSPKSLTPGPWSASKLP